MIVKVNKKWVNKNYLSHCLNLLIFGHLMLIRISIFILKIIFIFFFIKNRYIEFFDMLKELI